MSDVTIKSYRKEVEASIMGNLEKAMERVGQIVQDQAKINTNRTPPAHPQVGERGELMNSISHTVEKSGSEITTTIGTNVKHGLYLELGTVKMPPYPWLYPAVESKKSEIIETIKSGGGKLTGIEYEGNVDVLVGT